MCNVIVLLQLWLLRKDYCPLRGPGSEGDGCRHVYGEGQVFQI